MHRLGRAMVYFGSLVLLCCGAGSRPASAAESRRPTELALPRHQDGWIVPATGNGQPMWGIDDGIQVGLWPLRGPRGLIRIYAPYVCGQSVGREPLINFIAVEPVVDGKRGYSEMETSRLDRVQGLRMWTGTDLEGKMATQYWRAEPVPGLSATVNARVTYWASNKPIPGGLSYENFELRAPFRPGQVFTFGVTLRTPAELGFQAEVKQHPEVQIR